MNLMKVVRMQIIKGNTKEQYFFMANLDAKRLGAFISKAYQLMNGDEVEEFPYAELKHLPPSVLLNKIIIYLRDEFFHYNKDQVDVVEVLNYKFEEKE